MASAGLYKALNMASSIPAVDPITSIVKAAAIITETILSIADAAKRRRMEQAVDLLDNAAKIKLANELQQQQDSQEKIMILEDSLNKYGAVAIAAQQQREKILLYGSAIIAFIFLAIAIYINNSKKTVL